MIHEMAIRAEVLFWDWSPVLPSIVLLWSLAFPRGVRVPFSSREES